MRNVLFLLIFVQTAFGFTAKNSTEAKLTFSYFVQIHQKEQPDEDRAKAVIDDQLDYLYGTMAADKRYAVPRGEHTIQVTDIHEGEEEGVWEADYDYSGLIQVKKGPRTRYTVALPRDPSEEGIYDPGLNEGGNENLCTDEHYNSYVDYWYFWNPDQDGCSLREGEDFDRVQGAIERQPNTKESYPEYPRLAHKNADGAREILVYAFFGMDDENHVKDPIRGRDINAATYRKFRKGLIEMGFDELQRMEKEEINRILQGKHYRRPFVEVARKWTPKGNLKVVLFFGPTGINERSGAFHYFYKEANEKAAIMLYDGHSGLGGHLDLKAIETLNRFSLKQNPNRYQIFFFNSCTSYSYYNTVYFYRKAPRSVRLRTKSLDILTNGLATEFDGMAPVDLELIKAVDDWSFGGKVRSYQALSRVMDTHNLFGVNGDQDNPTSPEELTE
ncbi:MAG: hypothetical protein HYR96_01520 [Deltaproteobacteria bacterium]|nr:hypothetical protein [Deltaproteobacteria bacterium]MBI3293512.1 hypothetical protein [Deltaproteobacteria bacterium]